MSTIANSTPSVEPEERFYSAETIADILEISRATVWRWVKNGDAPPLRRIGPGVTRGRKSEWDSFMLDPDGWRAQHPRAGAAT